MSLLGLGRPTSGPGATTTKHPRQSSQNVFAMFDQKQIHQFKEAFSMMDSDSDSLITPNDIQTTLTSLGQKTPTQSNSLIQSFFPDETSRKRGINFTQFLAMFGEHLLELDGEDEMLDAFECFDEKDEGGIKGGELRYWLKEVGDKMTDEEIDHLLSPPFTDRQGTTFNYREFVRQLRCKDAETEEKEREMERMQFQAARGGSGGGGQGGGGGGRS